MTQADTVAIPSPKPITPVRPRPVQQIVPSPPGHWVGDGFPVRTVFSYQDLGPAISPFLLLDYAGPTQFPPTPERLGVGEHPHRGFETVTIVYQGGLEHRDSGGHHGLIGPGDVQWMTAASGVVHEEYHSQEFARHGGTFEVVQLWVNLPAQHKMSSPAYQTLLNRDIPVVSLPDSAGTVRIIAGAIAGASGPARTFTPVNLWDLRLRAGASVDLPIPPGHTAAIFLLTGSLKLNTSAPLASGELALFGPAGDHITFQANADATVLFLSGEPIPEPIVGRGPFVMNTEEEIRQAIRDYQSGKMGHLAAELQ